MYSWLFNISSGSWQVGTLLFPTLFQSCYASCYTAISRLYTSRPLVRAQNTSTHLWIFSLGNLKWTQFSLPEWGWVMSYSEMIFLYKWYIFHFSTIYCFLRWNCFPFVALTDSTHCDLCFNVILIMCTKCKKRNVLIPYSDC